MKMIVKFDDRDGKTIKLPMDCISVPNVGDDIIITVRSNGSSTDSSVAESYSLVVDRVFWTMTYFNQYVREENTSIKPVGQTGSDPIVICKIRQ